MTRVSVVIPTRDRPGLLRRAVGGVARQAGVDVELVVVDDGSATPVGDLGWPVERGTPPVVVRHERSQGVARARNAGIERATGRLVAFLDDDDLWRPDHLSGLVAALGPGDALAYSRHVVVDEAGRPLSDGPQPPGEVTVRRLLGANLVVTPSSVLADAALLRAEGGFDPGLAVLADWDLWIRLAARGAVRPVRALTAAYTMHGDNLHRDTSRLLEEHGRLAAKLAPVLARERTALGDELFWQWVASAAAPDRQRRTALRLYARDSWRRRPPAETLRGVRRLLRAPGLDHGRVEGLAPPAAEGWLAPPG